MEFRELLTLLWAQKKKVLVVLILASLVFFTGHCIKKPTYEVKGTLMIKNKTDDPWVSMYVEPKADTEIIKACIRLMDSRNFMLDVASNLSFSVNEKLLNNEIRYQHPEGTKLIQLILYSSEPKQAAEIINTILKLFSRKMAGTMELQNKILVIDKAIVPAQPYHVNILLEYCLVLFITFLWIIFLVMMQAHSIWRFKYETKA